ncbi:Ankyrin repeat domain 50 [Balamuthia mandrillaris]
MASLEECVSCPRGEEGEGPDSAFARFQALLQESAGSIPQSSIDRLLHCCLRAGQPEMAGFLLERHSADVESLEGRSRSNKKSCLMNAITSGIARNEECLLAVLQKGVPSAKQLNEALCGAAKLARLDYIKLLVEHGADVNYKEPNYLNTALHLCALRSDEKAIEYLLSKGASPSHLNAHAETALHKAVANPSASLECVRLLLQHGASVLVRAFILLSSLRFVLFTVHAFLLFSLAFCLHYLSSFLFQVCNKQGETAFYKAIERGNLAAAKLMIEQYFSQKEKEQEQHTTSLLHQAAMAGNAEIMEMLLSRDVTSDIGRKDNDGNTPLHLATMALKEKHLQQQLQQSARRSASDGLAMHHCYAPEDLKCIELLLEKDPSQLNVPSQQTGETPLHNAVKAGLPPSLITLFLSSGADPSLLNNNQRTALDEAAAALNVPCVTAFLDHILNNDNNEEENEEGKGKAKKVTTIALMEYRDDEGNSLLHKAATSLEFCSCITTLLSQNGNERRGKFLLHESIDFCLLIDEPNHNGDTPLMLALQHGVLDAVALLLDFGASLHSSAAPSSSKNVENNALDVAIKMGDIHALMLIVEKRGTNIFDERIKQRMKDYRDEEGLTLLHRAVRFNNIEATRLCIETAGLDLHSTSIYLQQQQNGVTEEGGDDEDEFEEDRFICDVYSRGGTPLHLLCNTEEGHVTETTKQLLRYILSQLQLQQQLPQLLNNTKDFEGNTPIHLCCQNNHLNLLEVMKEEIKDLSQAIDFEVTNLRGETAVDVAELYGFEECASFLRLLQP